MRSRAQKGRDAAEEVEGELERSRIAVEAVMPNLSETRDRLEEEAAILDVHTKFAQTPRSHSGVDEQIGNLEAAALVVSGEYAARVFTAMEDE